MWLVEIPGGIQKNVMGEKQAVASKVRSLLPTAAIAVSALKTAVLLLLLLLRTNMLGTCIPNCHPR